MYIVYRQHDENTQKNIKCGTQDQSCQTVW